MEIALSCSEALKDKLKEIAAGRGISFADDAGIVLVEAGFPQPPGRICIVFPAQDYREVIGLIGKDAMEETMLTDTIAGFYHNRYVVIDIGDILYMESDASEIRCVTKTHTCALKKTLAYYEKSLYHKGILRINKSQLVNLGNVREIVPWFNSRYVLVLENQMELEVSRLYARALRRALDI